jgi:hypothetical protein
MRAQRSTGYVNGNLGLLNLTAVSNRIFLDDFAGPSPGTTTTAVGPSRAEISTFPNPGPARSGVIALHHRRTFGAESEFYLIASARRDILRVGLHDALLPAKGNPREGDAKPPVSSLNSLACLLEIAGLPALRPIRRTAVTLVRGLVALQFGDAVTRDRRAWLVRSQTFAAARAWARWDSLLR